MIGLARISDSLRHRFQRRRMTPERLLGRRGEDYAHRFLEHRGYRVVARNYRTGSGGNEVDLIAWHKDNIVFVEVKSRTNDDSSSPERAVTPEKQRRIVRAAMDYTRRAGIEWGLVRFDVVSVLDGTPGGRAPVIELYADAFGVPARL